MNIMITSRHTTVPEYIKKYVRDKIQKLERYFEPIIKCDIIFDIVDDHQKLVEIKVKIYGTMLIVKENTDDFVKSIDIALDKLERQLKKYKDKLQSKSHTRTVEALVLNESIEENEEEDFFEENY